MDRGLQHRKAVLIAGLRDTRGIRREVRRKMAIPRSWRRAWEWNFLYPERGNSDEEEQICGSADRRRLCQAEVGMPVPELCRDHGISTAAFYSWRAKHGGMDSSMVSEMKAVQEENRRLKKMFAELSMQNELLKEALGRK
jgi:putative transposase